VTDLAIFYEHPDWLRPLFAVLDRRGVDYLAIHADGHVFDPGEGAPPAPLIFNRIAMSSFLREADHPIFYTKSLLAYWAAQGAHVINGPEAMAVDASKARQLSLISGLGYAIPKTRAAHRPADLLAAAADLAFPIVVKANIGGSGAGIVRFDRAEELEAAIADGLVPESIDHVWLAQEYVPARGGRITRLETLAGRFLYAIEVDGGGAFDLCPADACLVQPGKATVTIEHVTPSAYLIEAAERIVRAAQMDIGGVEVLIDDRDGVARFYDINGFSNFVANPLGVLGWDPHETLVDWLEGMIKRARA
jgi:glutathione synthase/RimK-type ligase-like ATP-grasp enzyme